MKIIPYEDKYFLGVRKVCLETASQRYKNFEEALYLLYCDYYLENEKNSCFIVLRDNDEVIGYILCAPSFKKYKTIFKEKYLPKLKEVSNKFYKEAKLELFGYSLLRNNYPAHLHIDILPIFQRMGLGRELFTRLKKHLIEESIGGVFLTCGYNNINAQKFYEHLGFKKIFKGKMVGVLYSMLIRKESNNGI